MKQHYIRKHGIQDRELLKELTGAGYAKRGKTTLKCPLETCPTCGQNYSKNYFYRHHRDRCAEGSISTNRPLYPGFAALIPPAEMLAKYSVTQPTPVNTEQIKKREETLKKWREIEEEQRRDQLVNPGKYPKERTPKGNSDIKYGKKDREKKSVETANEENSNLRIPDLNENVEDVVKSNEEDVEVCKDQMETIASINVEGAEKKDDVK